MLSRQGVRKSRLLLHIALPPALALAAMLWGTAVMLNGISDSVNRQEESRTWQAVRSALGSVETHLAGIASIGASIGVAELGDERIEPAELMRRADIAMYDAKQGGRNRCRRFDAEIDLRRGEDLAIANELRSFIAAGRFDAHDQPIVDSLSRAMVGVEVLARRPEGGSRTVDPKRFVAVAEEHGMIDQLGCLVLRTACRDLSGRDDLRVSVNISALQLTNRNLVADIARIAAEESFDLKRLDVEFTEGVPIANPKRARQVIADLRARGISISLDDFGTGYAGVGYLREFTFDRVKLDLSLTHTIPESFETQQIVHGTILIARGLSATILAEGIESEEQAQLMHLAGCQMLQGFHLGRPQPASYLPTMAGTPHCPASEVLRRLA